MLERYINGGQEVFNQGGKDVVWDIRGRKNVAEEWAGFFEEGEVRIDP